jgi:hypothetical protein
VPARRRRGHLGFLGALVVGPAMGVVGGYNFALAGVGMLLVLAAAATTAGLQAAPGMPGTLIAIIAMVVFGDSTAGTSIATAPRLPAIAAGPVFGAPSIGH